MKKFWNLMLAALVIIGAAACTENYDGIEKAQNTEGFSFYAEVVNDGTRAYIDNEDGDKTWNTVWEQGDKLIVKVAEYEHAGVEPFEVEFECKDAAKGQFVSYDSNAAYLQDQNVTITTAGTHHSLEGKNAFYTNTVVNGFDNAEPIYLEAHTSFFRYTYNGEGEVKLTLSEAAFRAEDGTATKEVTVKGAKGENFIAFWPTGEEVKLTFSANGETKEVSKAFAAGMVYNLGDRTPVYKVYVYKYNTDWSNVYMYMWDDVETYIFGIWPGSTTTAKETINGYEYMVWTIPTQHNGKTVSMILNNNNGSQTANFNLGVINEDKYVILNNGMASFIEDPNNPEPTAVDGQSSEWALVGAFSSWADKTMLTTTDANVVVLKNVTMKAAEGFLVRKPKTDWDDKYGAGNVNYIKANHYIVTSKGGVDMCLEADGVYDVYFNHSNHNLYVVEAGADYTAATKQTVSGEEPKQEEPEVTEKVVYLKPNTNWTQGNARFAAYFWGGTTGEKWVSMTACGDGTYEAHLPEGYDYGCNIIFARMNPSTTANNWNNKWNQSSDLKTPTDGKNLYTVKAGTWDKGGGTWSTK